MGHTENSVRKSRFPTPQLKDLISEKNDQRKRIQRKIAIIIPSNRKSDALWKHIELLSKQTCKEFDIIAIYGQDDRFIEAPAGTSIIHLRRSYDFGSAGAFYCGEKFAFAEGYAKIILADDDCMPESEDLIWVIGSSLDKHIAVMPKTRFRPGDRPQRHVLAQYGAFRKEAIEKAGFSFLPFYFGAEDIDLKDRMEKIGIEVSSIESVVAHPPPQNLLLWSMEKNHYFIRNTNIRNWLRWRSKILFFQTAFGCLMMAAYFSAIGKFRMAGRYQRALSSLASLRLFKEDLGSEDGDDIRKLDGPSPYYAFGHHPEFMRFDIWYGAPALWPKDSGSSGPEKKHLRYLHDLIAYGIRALSCMGKEIHIKRWESEFHLLPVLFSRSATAGFEGSAYQITYKRGIAQILSGLVIMIMALIPAALISAALTLRISLQNVDGLTDDYGMDYDA